MNIFIREIPTVLKSITGYITILLHNIFRVWHFRFARSAKIAERATWNIPAVSERANNRDPPPGLFHPMKIPVALPTGDVNYSGRCDQCEPDVPGYDRRRIRAHVSARARNLTHGLLGTSPRAS